MSKSVAVNGATAHAHSDTDGTVYNLGNSYDGGAMYNVIKILPPNHGRYMYLSLMDYFCPRDTVLLVHMHIHNTQEMRFLPDLQY